MDKRPSTPADPARAVLEGLSELAPPGTRVVHGTTVATNALLERRGARTAFLTTAGFGDLLFLARQDRPALYDLAPRRPAPLVPPDLCFEIDERLSAEGTVLVPLNTAQMPSIIARLRAARVEAVSLCLLFAYRNPEHERLVAQALREALPAVFLSVGHEVLPEFREYERAATVTLNAYVGPVIARYLERLERGLAGQGRGPLFITQSNGGVLTAAGARRWPVRTVLSGPAAGVVGGFAVARQAGFSQVMTFDMGGTSTDVALCPGEIPWTEETRVGDLPIRLPAVAVQSVGAGGGSIARLDAGGALRVGPESAGADPGPACYGRGDQPTVTDANLVAGRLLPAYFLGGRLRLDVARARAALGRLGRALGWSPEETALGVLAVAEAAMERALWQVSVARGYDPRDFVLVAFGGAGPLHAAALATALGMTTVLVPRYPGVLAAIGAISADLVRDESQAVLARLTAVFDQLPALARRLVDRVRAEFSPADWDQARLAFALDLRLAGQGYELTTPWQPGEALAAVVARFHGLHRQRYAFHLPDRPVEVVAVRLRVTVPLPRPLEGEAAAATAPVEAALVSRQPVLLADGWRETPVYDRARLGPGHALAGPALVVQADATTLVPPGWWATVDRYGHLRLRRDGG